MEVLIGPCELVWEAGREDGVVRHIVQRFVCISGSMKTPEASGVNIKISGRRTKRVYLRCYIAGEPKDGELALQPGIQI